MKRKRIDVDFTSIQIIHEEVLTRQWGKRKNLRMNLVYVVPTATWNWKKNLLSELLPVDIANLCLYYLAEHGWWCIYRVTSRLLFHLFSYELDPNYQRRLRVRPPTANWYWRDNNRYTPTNYYPNSSLLQRFKRIALVDFSHDTCIFLFLWEEYYFLQLKSGNISSIFAKVHEVADYLLPAFYRVRVMWTQSQIMQVVCCLKRLSSAINLLWMPEYLGIFPPGEWHFGAEHNVQSLQILPFYYGNTSWEFSQVCKQHCKRMEQAALESPG